MAELCRDLKLSIFKEDDPEETGRERVRVKLVDELNMLELEKCYQINQTTIQSRRFHVLEAVTIVLRQVVSEAFKAGIILDGHGTWTTLRPASPASSSTGLEIDLELS